MNQQGYVLCPNGIRTRAVTADMTLGEVVVALSRLGVGDLSDFTWAIKKLAWHTESAGLDLDSVNDMLDDFFAGNGDVREEHDRFIESLHRAGERFNRSQS